MSNPSSTSPPPTQTRAPARQGSLRELWEHRELIANLTRRDLKTRYKRSVLGWLWSLLNPGASLLTYSIVFGVFIGTQAPVSANGLQNFPVYLFSGLIMWNAFSATFSGAMGALPDAGPLLTKVYFPPAAPAMAVVAGVLFQHAIEVGILLVVLAILGNAGWTFLFVPIFSFSAIALGLGLGMVAGLYQTRYRDVGYLVAIGLQLAFYATPIVYRIDSIGIHADGTTATLWGKPPSFWLHFNPMTSFVGGMRSAVYELRAPGVWTLIGSVLLAVVVLTWAWWFFNRKAPQLIEEL